LTASPAIGKEVAQLAIELFGGEDSVSENQEFNPIRIAPPKPFEMGDSARSELIESNPDYGIIVCRCEEISKGEILEALRRNVKCNSLDGVKRRVRAGMGRCHGSFCSSQVLDIIAAERRLPPHNIRKSGSGSEVLFGNSKALLQKKASSAQRISDRDSKADAETTALLHQKALEIQAAKEQNRKDSINDGDE